MNNILPRTIRRDFTNMLTEHYRRAGLTRPAHARRMAFTHLINAKGRAWVEANLSAIQSELIQIEADVRGKRDHHSDDAVTASA